MKSTKTYGFKGSNKNIITLGEYLKSLRENSSATFLDIAKKTNIDISTLYKLEKGEISRVNFFMLKKIANYYKINFLFFLLEIGITTENEILNFVPFIENDTSDNKLISVYKSFKDYRQNNVFTHINYVYEYKDTLSAFFIDDHIFVFDSYVEDIKNEVIIFSVGNEIKISNILGSNNNYIFFDQSKESITEIPKEKIVILGKLLYKIKNFD